MAQTTKQAFTAKVGRGERYWLIHIPEIDQWTQARALSEVETMARDLIALWLEITPDSFDLDVTIELPQSVRDHLSRGQELTNQAAALNAQAAAERRAAARELKSMGLTVRDIGQTLGISFPRAQQLLSRPDETQSP